VRERILADELGDPLHVARRLGVEPLVRLLDLLLARLLGRRRLRVVARPVADVDVVAELGVDPRLELVVVGRLRLAGAVLELVAVLALVAVAGARLGLDRLRLVVLLAHLCLSLAS